MGRLGTLLSLCVVATSKGPCSLYPPRPLAFAPRSSRKCFSHFPLVCFFSSLFLPCCGPCRDVVAVDVCEGATVCVGLHERRWCAWTACVTVVVGGDWTAGVAAALGEGGGDTLAGALAHDGSLAC